MSNKSNLKLRLALTIAAGAGVLLTTGCASVGTGAGAQAAFNDDIDYQRVALINYEASRRGVSVFWYNMPQKRTAVAQNGQPAQE